MKNFTIHTWTKSQPWRIL